MYTIEDMLYGFKMTLVSEIATEEMGRFVADAHKIMKEKDKTEFRVLIDMREASLGSQAAAQKWTQGVDLFKQMGMANSVVMGPDKTSTMEDFLLKKAG